MHDQAVSCGQRSAKADRRQRGVRRGVLLLALATMGVLLTGGCGDSESAGPTEAPQDQTTEAPDPTVPTTLYEPPCSAEALLAEAEAGVGGPGADAAAIHSPDRSVTSFACTPASMGDLVGGYAWARVEAGSLEPIVVFYSAYEGQSPDGGPLFGEWETLAWGTDATCDEAEEIPAEACDLLTGAPRG